MTDLDEIKVLCARCGRAGADVIVYLKRETRYVHEVCPGWFS